MNRTVQSLLLCAALAGPARAEAPVVELTVKGMVCSFCAQGIEKRLLKRPEVAAVRVDLEDKRVGVTMKEGRDVPDAELKAIVNDAGYDVVEVRRKSPK